MIIDRKTIENMLKDLRPKAKLRLQQAVEWIVDTKKRGGRVVVVVGSGPNLHEGSTTLIAELIHKGVIDGVLTSSAVIGHEMGGTLEKVKRVYGTALGFQKENIPADGFVEVSLLPRARLQEFQKEVPVDIDLYRRMRRAKGNVIVKVAGNIAYPTGFRTERLALDVLKLAREKGTPFEQIVGYGADPYTMIGAGSERSVPILVTVPQLVGGGKVGMAIGDSLPISDRCRRVAELLASADIIIESAVALAQEIHDGPFETFTGHGMWSSWEKEWTYSLSGKRIIRLDLDPNLERAWGRERRSRIISDAVNKGLPKTKLTRIPFRMEMSGFARLPGSLPVIGDIGAVWPLMATMVADGLGMKLDFMSYSQSTPAGQRVREWIVDNIQPVNKNKLLTASERLPRRDKTTP